MVCGKPLYFFKITVVSLHFHCLSAVCICSAWYLVFIVVQNMILAFTYISIPNIHLGLEFESYAYLTDFC